jgi:hypothetical protein
MRSPIFVFMVSSLICMAIAGCKTTDSAGTTQRHKGERRLNNLVAELLEVTNVKVPGTSFNFTRRNEGWIFVSVESEGDVSVKLFLDDSQNPVIDEPVRGSTGPAEGFRRVSSGRHTLRVECDKSATLRKLSVRAVPELIDCGLFDPAIKSYGHYDLAFLQKDILPNITTLITPQSVNLSQEVIDDWHRQGKRFIAQSGVNSQATTAEEHFQHWTKALDTAKFADGIIIDEFIINRPSDSPLSPERAARREKERERHKLCEDAFKRIRSDARYKDKTIYTYIGGSGNTLNQEVIGNTFVRTLMDCHYPVALERYIFERSSEQGSKDALKLFVDGIADWEAKEPGVTSNMVMTFGLFSMPPGGINKLPNVDYHVWMDQQMNVLANDPVMANVGGINWWTSSQTDEETVRFVGKLYRHYAIEGKSGMYTKDPLFLTHIQNADFEKGIEGWTLHSAEEGAIRPGSFPRYGRIEGRYMGLGRPADPEHIGDTFLVMKRSEKGPNTFSQPIKDLQPGRLYSMKMFTCDYNDLVNSTAKKQEEAHKFIGKVTIDSVELDTARSFTEMYASNPEPKIPVWITYHWYVFKAKDTKAHLTVSDWTSEVPEGPYGLEQTFNFLEIQPYHD